MPREDSKAGGGTDAPMFPYADSTWPAAAPAAAKSATAQPLQANPELICLAEQIRPRSLANRIWSELAQSIRAHSLIAVMVFIYWAAAIGVSGLVGVHPVGYLDVLMAGLGATTIVYFGGLLTLYLAYIMIVVHPKRPVLYLWKDLTSRILTLRRLCTALPVVLLLPMLISSYGSLKLEIPLLRPYDWDASLARLERLINGGYQAWEWLQPLLGFPLATWSLNAVYNSWYLVFYGIFFWQLASTSRPDLRMRYLLVCVLQWAILGNLLGTLMSSAGPAFYGRLVEGSDPYAPLMQYLHWADSVRPIWALKTQDFLWQCYAKREFLVGCGISAMPSMHVATSFSFVLLAFATNRLLGAVMSVYCALILIGSVQLGWHYVSDGYIAIIGTWLIWLSMGWFLNRTRIKEWLALGPLSQPVPCNAAARSQSEAGPPP